MSAHKQSRRIGCLHELQDHEMYERSVRVTIVAFRVGAIYAKATSTRQLSSFWSCQGRPLFARFSRNDVVTDRMYHLRKAVHDIIRL